MKKYSWQRSLLYGDGKTVKITIDFFHFAGRINDRALKRLWTAPPFWGVYVPILEEAA